MGCYMFLYTICGLDRLLTYLYQTVVDTTEGNSRARASFNAIGRTPAI